MREIILFSAASLDDFIARPDGNIDWLNNPDIMEDGEDFGYGAFYSSIDTTLTGNSTYKQVMEFDIAFPYPDKKNYVFTREPGIPPTAYVEFISGNIAEFCAGLKKGSGQAIWLVGGGMINSILLEAGLIDKLIITKIPIVLGKGIPLFNSWNWKSKFISSSTKVFKKGVVQLELRKAN